MSVAKGVRRPRVPASMPAEGVAAGESAVQRLATASPRARASRSLAARADASAASRASAALQRRADGATLQRAGIEEEEPLQGRFDVAQRQMDDEEMMMKSRAAPAQRQGLEEEELMQGRFAPAQPAAKQTGGALPKTLRDGAQALAGTDLSDVRVDFNSAKPAAVAAHAYAQGNKIHLGPGQERHLPHEAWHIVQQRQGRVRPTTDVAGVPVNDDPGLEHEADKMGARALDEGRRQHKRSR